MSNVRRVVFTNEFLQVSEDVNQADYCDDDNYQTAIPIEERAELPQGENIPESTRRYPVRERRPPEYFYSVAGDEIDDHDAVNVDFCYSVRDLPQSYTEAVHSPDSQNWRNAMDEEVHSLKENDTFTLTSLPEGKQTVGGRWVYAVKESAGGTLTLKARYVAKGYSQTKDIDYFETYAPTTQMTSIRVLMQLAAKLDLTVHQLDVKTAYLNAPIDCEIYLEQAEGYEVPGKDKKLVSKLNK